VHALIIACVHRTAHHFDEPRLIWLYDIHLLAARLDGRAWADLVAQASARQVAAVCRNGLTEAVASLGTAVPRDVLEALSDAARSEAGVQAYAGGGRTQARRVADDLRAVGSWRRRWRLVGQHLFPPARYMREVYAPGSRAPLAALYARRAWRGARRWLRSS
jgi:hypothetical protein